MQIVWLYLAIMGYCVVLGAIICKIFLPWMSAHLKMFMVDLQSNPEVWHLHQLQMLFLYIVIAITITVKLWWLWSFCALMSNAPRSALAIKARTNLSSAQTTWCSH